MKHTTRKSHRVSSRSRPVPKRTRFRTVHGAVTYAASNNWPVTEHISTPRGDRIQVVTRGGPRTLRVG